MLYCLFLLKHYVWEDIMRELKISRGNTSMSLRQLIDWGIVYKSSVPGERREFFSSEKDVQELARTIARERSRREIQPTLKILKDVCNIEDDGTVETQELKKKTKELFHLADTANTMMSKIVEQDANWLTKTLVKLLS